VADKKLDARLNAYRADLAAASLEGSVDALKYAAGDVRQVIAAAAPVRRLPRFDAPLDTEALHGELVRVYDESEGWAWGQLERDRYVGYLPAECLSTHIAEPTHKVRALRTFAYPADDIKTPPLELLSFGSSVRLMGLSGDFVQIGSNRFLFARHVVPFEAVETDFVSVAMRFVGTPYLWGGRQSLGLDCSALVQLALSSAGVACPRDSDMQEAELGDPLPDPEDISALQRGDLLFWPGHVAIVAGDGQLLHANAFHMETVIEPLAPALARIESGHAKVRAVKRLAGACLERASD